MESYWDRGYNVPRWVPVLTATPAEDVVTSMRQDCGIRHEARLIRSSSTPANHEPEATWHLRG